jgi:MFS family permease
MTDQLGSLNLMGWYGIAYLLAMCFSRPIIIKLSTAYPYSGTHLISLFIFTVGSVVCATASGSPSLILGRALCGLTAHCAFYWAVASIKDVMHESKVEATTFFLIQLYGVSRLIGPM